jgi:hypothetical protein
MFYDSKTSIYTGAPPAVIPDGLSLYDFMFQWRSSATPGATTRPDPVNSTWLIDAPTGRTLDYKGAHDRTIDLARAFNSLGVGVDDAVLLFSSNEVRRRICSRDDPVMMTGECK